MMKHLKRFVAVTISMVMAFQFCTNDFYLYAETEPADPGQTQVTNEPESGPSDSTEEAAEETPSSDTGTPEPSAPVEEQPAAPVEEQPAAPVEEQPEVASILKVEFVDANNASVKETVEQALESKYVGKTINLDELGIDTNVEGYTLTEVKDKNDNTQVYTTETKDFVLTGNVTELQFVYTQNAQTDQPEDSQEPSTPQGGQEDQNSEEDEESDTPTIRDMLAEDESRTLEVNVVHENGTLLGTYALPMGEIRDNLPTSDVLPNLEGLEFKYAGIEESNTEITYIAYYQENYYYSTSGNNVAGILLTDEDIQLVYGEKTITHSITYNVYVDDSQTPIEKDQYSEYISLDAPEIVVNESNLEFLLSAKKGYEIARVTEESSGDIIGEDGKYTVSDVTYSQRINIYLKTITKYKISFRGSNTRFTYEGNPFNSGANGHGTLKEFEYSSNLSNLSFTLQGYNEYTSEDKELNKLTISIGDNKNIAVLLPGETAGGGNTATTTVDGITIQVTRGDRGSIGGVSSYIYTVNIQCDDKLRDDIEIVTNFKDSDSRELFVKQTIGVGSKDGNPGVYSPQGLDDGILNPSDGNDSYVQIGEQNKGDKLIEFYFNVLPGYIDDPAYINVTGTYDGKDASDYISEIQESELDGYKYKVTVRIPSWYIQDWFSSWTGTKTTDWRLFFTATPNDNYLVKYDLDGGQNGPENQNYSKVSNFMIPSDIPTREGYVFDGWIVQNSDSLEYDPYEIVSFSDVANYVHWNANLKVSELTLVAKWIPEAEADTVQYNVNVYFENESGEYPTEANISLAETAVPNKPVYLMPEKLMDRIIAEGEAPSNVDDYEIDTQKSQLYIENVESGAQINVYYRIKKIPITVSVNNGTSLQEGINYVKKGTDFKVEYQANEGYILQSVVVDGINLYIPDNIADNPSIVNEYLFEDVSKSSEIVITYVRKTDGFTVKGFNVPYDGTTHKVTLNGTIKGEKWQYSKDNGTTWEDVPEDGLSYTDVEESPGSILIRVVDEENEVVWQTNEANPVEVQITPAPLTVKTGSASKVYDGTPLTKTDGYTFEGLKNGETAGFKVTGRQIEVGDTPNTFEITWAAAGNEYTAKESNYAITTKELGTLEVTAQTIEDDKVINVDQPSNVKYDGLPHQWEPAVTKAGSQDTLTKDVDYTVEYSTTDFTNVTGEIKVTIKGKGNYAGEITRAYQITPAPLTVKTGSASKVY
ncbi:InlB B-repeat-containing protein, partial [Faecalitalea cylindroides]